MPIFRHSFSYKTRIRGVAKSSTRSVLELIGTQEPTLGSEIISGEEVIEPRFRIPFFAGKLEHQVRRCANIHWM